MQRPGTFGMPALLLRSLENSTHEEKVRELKGRERCFSRPYVIENAFVFRCVNGPCSLPLFHPLLTI